MEKLDSSEIQVIADTAVKFAQKEIASRVDLESHEPPEFPWDIVRAGGDAGYLTGPLPEDYCGAELDTFSNIVILENLARAAAGPAAVFAIHNMALTVLDKHRDNVAVKAYLDKLANAIGEQRPPLVAIAVPETVVDDNRPASPMVVDAEGGLRVRGDFLCLFDPAHAEQVMLMFSTDKGSKIAMMNADDLMQCRRDAYPGSGLEECPIARLRLDDFQIPDESLVGEDDCASAMRTLKTFMGAVMVGTSSEAARAAREYAHERIQTGRPIIEHQEVEKTLAEMDMRIEAARSMLYSSVLGKGIADPGRAYLFCGDVAESVCLNAVQTLGGYGYMKDYGIEKRLRDVKSLQTILGSYPEDWFI